MIEMLLKDEATQGPCDIHKPLGRNGLAHARGESQMPGGETSKMVVKNHDVRGCRPFVESIEQDAGVYRQYTSASVRQSNQISAIKAQMVRLRLEERDDWDSLTDKQQWELVKKEAPTIKELPFEYKELEHALATFEAKKKFHAKRMEAAVKKLPVWEWAATVRGFGAVNLALIISEAGDLSNYAGPQKLRKRMGLMPGQRRVKAKKDIPEAAELATALGYCPRRRALMHVVGECLIKLNNGKYRKAYDDRKAYEREQAEAKGLKVLPAARITQKNKDRCRSEGHIHKRAMRVMEQQLLNDLWGQWNAERPGLH